MNRRGFVTAALEGAAAGVMAPASQAIAAECAVTPLALPVEAPIDPDWPIVDAHHHLWDYPARRGQPLSRYLLPDFLADIDAGGHRITRTVFVDCMTMYREDGPVEMRSLGETEFVNGIAAMSASGGYGRCRVAAGIVTFLDLRPGDAARPVLEAHLAAAGDRLKGVRNSAAWDPYPVMGIPLDPARADWLSGDGIRVGVAALAAHGLAFETWIFHTQIPQLAALADAVPRATIVLGHCGTPIGVGPYAQRKAETFAVWKRNILELARRPNVVVKVGGLGMKYVSPELTGRSSPAGSEEIAAAWRPVVETCIEAFGPSRCMFESNFPPDSATCSYGTLWNVFKRLTAGYSPAERTALFSGTAERVFRLTPAAGPASGPPTAVQGAARKS